MRDKGDRYEYICTYVNDIAVVSFELLKIIDALQGKPYNFKLKGTTNIDGAVHLGSHFSCDEDGVLTMDPDHYIKRMEESYNQRFPGEKIDRRVTSPLDPGDHPELDTSEFLPCDEVQIYQSLIGAMQWAISIGRFDIQTHIMTLSSFRAQPR